MKGKRKLRSMRDRVGDFPALLSLFLSLFFLFGLFHLPKHFFPNITPHQHYNLFTIRLKIADPSQSTFVHTFKTKPAFNSIRQRCAVRSKSACDVNSHKMAHMYMNTRLCIYTQTFLFDYIISVITFWPVKTKVMWDVTLLQFRSFLYEARFKNSWRTIILILA